MTRSRLSRSTPLTADRSHNWELVEGKSAGTRTYRCTRCGEEAIVSVTGSPPDWRNCPGMKRSRLERGPGPKPVSDRRTEKRKARGVRGPLQGSVAGRRCLVPGCLYKSDPAHVESVGSGRNDWLWTGTRWVGRVADLCRIHHSEFDGQVGGGSREHFEREHGVDVESRAVELGGAFAEEHGISLESEEHPYEQIGWR